MTAPSIEAGEEKPKVYERIDLRADGKKSLLEEIAADCGSERTIESCAKSLGALQSELLSYKATIDSIYKETLKQYQDDYKTLKKAGRICFEDELKGKALERLLFSVQTQLPGMRNDKIEVIEDVFHRKTLRQTLDGSSSEQRELYQISAAHLLYNFRESLLDRISPKESPQREVYGRFIGKCIETLERNDKMLGTCESRDDYKIGWTLGGIASCGVAGGIVGGVVLGISGFICFPGAVIGGIGGYILGSCLYPRRMKKLLKKECDMLRRDYSIELMKTDEAVKL